MRLWSSARLGAALVFSTIVVAPVSAAGPEARVRVRGAARIDASAATSSSGFVLQGSVLEDGGQPVAAARLRIRMLARDGSPRLLPRSEACAPSPAHNTAEPFRAGEEASAETDINGRFCLRWPVDLPDGRLIVTFDDMRLLLDSAEQSVEIERTPSIELAFTPLPTALSLDAPEVSLTLTSQSRDDAATRELPLSLLWTRVGTPTTSLLTRPLRIGETAHLRLPSRDFGGPGPGELRARLGSPEHAVEIRAPVVIRATVALNAPDTARLSSKGEGTLSVRVESVAGAVTSGSVEALSGDRTVGIAPVSGGRAELWLAVGSEPGTVPVVLRYLPASPWWVAGSPSEIQVSVPRASPVRGALWALALLAIAGWMAAAWRRPPRLDRPLQAGEAGPAKHEPSVQWLAPVASERGWSGCVIDAHDGTPIAGATVSVALADGQRQHAVSEPDGEFRIELALAADRTGTLRVEGRWHSPLDWSLPPEGRIGIALMTRRRTLLARLIDWAGNQGAPWSGTREPTPADISRTAEQLAEPQIATWARSVEAVAFGPGAVDGTQEENVRSLEPNPRP